MLCTSVSLPHLVLTFRSFDSLSLLPLGHSEPASGELPGLSVEIAHAASAQARTLLFRFFLFSTALTALRSEHLSCDAGLCMGSMPMAPVWPGMRLAGCVCIPAGPS